MSRKFAIFILTHGRPDNIKTLTMLEKCGWTGKTYIVIDDEDKRADEYFQRYGDMVLQFNKKEIADQIDDADTSGDRRAIIYARHASQHMAKALGLDYMLQLDDDYADLRYRFIKKGVLTSFRVKDFDSLAEATLRTDRYVDFKGKINDDVNLYVVYGAQGELIFTSFHVNVLQMATQANQGGMTELYLEEGTYAKSFYSVMMAPSCVKIYPMGTANRRLHHKVDWRYAVPKIINQKYRKAIV